MASAKRPVLLDASRSKSKNPRGTTELFKLGQFPNMVSRDTKNGQETAEVERLDGGLKGVEGPGSLRLEGAEWSALWGSATIGVAVLDDRGDMVEANGAWRRPATENRLVRDWQVGSSYIAVCRAASSSCPHARSVAEGLGLVISGERSGVHVEYSCGQPGRSRWFVMRATRIEQDDSFEVVLANEEITSIRVGEGRIFDEDEESLALLFRSTHVIPWRGRNGTLAFDYVGGQAVDMLGYPLEMWYEEGFWTSHVHPDDLQRVASACQQNAIDMPVDLEYRVFAVDGRIVWVRHIGISVVESDGSRVRGFFIDITDGKHAGAALKEKELRLNIAERSVRDGLFLLNVQQGNGYIFTSVNPSFLRITGLTRQQIIGKPVVEVIEGLAATSVLARLDHAVGDNRTVVWEERVRFPSGERICEIVATPITNDAANHVQILAAIQDVTADEQSRTELVNSLTLNQAVLSSLPNPVAILDEHGEVIAANQAWNRDWKKASGVSSEGVAAGENYLEFCKKAAQLGVASSRDKYDGIRSVIDGSRDYFEMEYLSGEPKGGSTWYKMVATPSPATGGAVVSHLDITGAKLADERVRDLSGRLIHGQEEERKRIARELHDDVNQRLALLAIELEQFAREKSESDVEAQRRAQDLCALAQSISSDVHRLSHKLHPSKLDHLGLIDAARDFCTEISQHHGVHVDFFHRDVPDRIPGEISLCIFRIIQESLQNVVKHSGAKQAYVGLVGQGGEIHLEVSDPGAGFDADSDKGKAGLGLVSMRERVRFAGGEMWIRSRRSHGTRINVKMPLRAPALKKAPVAILIDN